MQDFDYKIVGAGSSGCVLADRLSADGRTTVPLLEAGSDNETELVRMPRAFLVETARSRSEVVLAAGTLPSPKLLQRSGIGPAAAFERAGVPLVMNAPAGGPNLADHVTFSMSFRMKGYKGANRQFSGWRLLRHVAQYYAFRSGLNGYYLRPKSRGSVAIQSGNIKDPVMVDAHLWHDPDDRRALVRMLRLMRAFAAQPALKPYTLWEVTPGAQFESDDDIGRALDWLAGPGLHATGTCRMGPTADSVLDSRLRVNGIERLRVVDCSAIPTPPSGNSNAPAMMLGYRAAELIIEDRNRMP